jgi:hypothetical protein
MMQVPVHQVIDMVAVRDGLMAACRTVHMAFLVGSAVVIGRAILGIPSAHVNLVVVHVIAVSMMQVAIVKVIRMTVVFYRCMPAVRAMFVSMSALMLPVSLGHGRFSSRVVFPF